MSALQRFVFHLESLNMEFFSLTGDEGSYRPPEYVSLFVFKEIMFSAEKIAGSQPSLGVG